MGAWVELRDSAEAAAVLYGNYLLPGSSMVTKHLVSDGAEEKLDSDWGRLAQLGTGGGGIADGNLANYTGGEGAGTKLPFFGESSGGVSGLKLDGVNWADAPNQSAAETSRLLGQEASASGTPVGDVAVPASNSANNQMPQNFQQQQQTPPQQEDANDSADKNARRQALLEKAQRLREQIAALRAKVARESAIPQTVLGNPA